MQHRYSSKGLPRLQFGGRRARAAREMPRSVSDCRVDAPHEVAAVEECSNVDGHALGEQRRGHVVGVGDVRRDDAVARCPQRMPVGQAARGRSRRGPRPRVDRTRARRARRRCRRARRARRSRGSLRARASPSSARPMSRCDACVSAAATKTTSAPSRASASRVLGRVLAAPDTAACCRRTIVTSTSNGASSRRSSSATPPAPTITTWAPYRLRPISSACQVDARMRRGSTRMSASASVSACSATGWA